jgi:thiosulfate/3-mercaptopyruvate sulfurtransferase
MRAAGVCSGRPVVVYDAADSTAAARAWWLLRYFGHGDVLVLDGGLAAWVAAGQPLSPDLPAPARGDFLARPGFMPVASEADVATAEILIDARARERFSGAHEPIDPVAGHIPGALNRPTSENVDPTGRFLPPPQLRAAFEQLGVHDGVRVATYCGSGVTASHQVLAIELAGYEAALYPGSWSEWIADPERPVEVTASSASSGE